MVQHFYSAIRTFAYAGAATIQRILFTRQFGVDIFPIAAMGPVAILLMDSRTCAEMQKLPIARHAYA